MAENKLNVIDLHKRYGEHEVLKGVSAAGECGRRDQYHRLIRLGKKYLPALHQLPRKAE